VGTLEPETEVVVVVSGTVRMARGGGEDVVTLGGRLVTTAP
jgi:hypothetical protein